MKGPFETKSRLVLEKCGTVKPKLLPSPVTRELQWTRKYTSRDRSIAKPYLYGRIYKELERQRATILNFIITEWYTDLTPFAIET